MAQRATKSRKKSNTTEPTAAERNAAAKTTDKEHLQSAKKALGLLKKGTFDTVETTSFVAPPERPIRITVTGNSAHVAIVGNIYFEGSPPGAQPIRKNIRVGSGPSTHGTIPSGAYRFKGMSAGSGSFAVKIEAPGGLLLASDQLTAPGTFNIYFMVP